MRVPPFHQFVRTSPTLALLLLAPSAAAQDVPDVSAIVNFIRVGGVFASLGVIVGAGIAARFLNNIVESLGQRFVHRRLTFQKAESFLRFGIYLTTGAVVIALSFRINDTVLALVGGTLAVAVGFALRDLVAAMIAGVTIMFDRPFQVGDRVQFAGEYGDVTAIGLRSVRIQTLDDNTVTVPNNKVLTDVTSCGNYGALDMQVQINFFIGVDQDFVLATRLVKEAMLTSQYIYLQKPLTVQLKQVVQEHHVAIQLRAKGYVLDTRYEKAYETDVSIRTLLAFREHGVLGPSILHRQIGGREPPAGAQLLGPTQAKKRTSSPPL